MFSRVRLTIKERHRRSMKGTSDPWDVLHTCPCMQINQVHCVPLQPLPPPPAPRWSTKRSRSNFHPVRNFYFSTNETTKGVNPDVTGRGKIPAGTIEVGRGAAFTFLGRSTVGTVSVLRQSIQLPGNRHRRWEDES